MPFFKQIGTYKRWYLLISLPLIVTILFMSVSTYISFSKMESDIINNSKMNLKYIAQDNTLKVRSLIKNVSFLEQSESFMEVFASTNDFKIFEDKDITKAVIELNDYMNNHEIIDSMFLINRSFKFVISQGGQYTLDNFFTEQTIYKEMPLSYWENQSPLFVGEYSILTPTAIVRDNAEIDVIPVVFKKIGSKVSSNLVVMNISIDKLLNYAYGDTLDDSMNLFMFNRQTKDVFSAKYNKGIKSLALSDIENNITQSRNSVGYASVKDNMIFSYYSGEFLRNYVYIIAMPRSYIAGQIRSYTLFSGGIFILALLLGVIVMFAAFKHIVRPVKNLTQKIDIDSNSKDVLEQLGNILLSDNEYKNMLPFFQEKYLIDILNSNEYLIEAEQYKELEKHLPKFKYDYFASVVFQLHPKNKLFEVYNIQEFKNIQGGFYNMIKSLFCEKNEALVLTSEKETLYVLINTPDEDDTNIRLLINQVKMLLINDFDVIDLMVGCGGIYRGIEGMKKAHREAIDSISIISMPIEQITFNSSVSNNSIYDLFTLSDENKFYNLLINKKTDEAIEFIESVINRAKTHTVPVSGLKQFYSQVLYVILRIMRVQKIEYDESNKGDVAYIKRIIDLPIEERHAQILEHIVRIGERRDNSHANNTVDEVIEYIDSHFHEELFLDKLSEIFNVSADYISRAIKKKVGIGFHEYLMRKKIEAAKEMLLNTQMSVEEIYSYLGYQSRVTFTRNFKSMTGQTPTEYKEQFKN